MARSPVVLVGLGSVLAVLLALPLGGCPHGSPPPAPPAGTLPARAETCYAGVSTTLGAGAHDAVLGQSSRTLVRRVVDPAASRIVEDVAYESAGGPKALAVIEDVAAGGSEMKVHEAHGAFAGTGILNGDPWRWLSWSTTARIVQPSGAAVTVDADVELVDGELQSTKKMRRDGQLIASTTDKLRPFDCATWDGAVAELAHPMLDDDTCRAACANYATLRYRAVNDARIAALPETERAAATDAATGKLAELLAAKVPDCVRACRAANDVEHTTCWRDAQSDAALTACDAR